MDGIRLRGASCASHTNDIIYLSCVAPRCRVHGGAGAAVQCCAVLCGEREVRCGAVRVVRGARSRNAVGVAGSALSFKASS